MKRILLLTILAMLISICAFSQDYRFGKVSEQELSMTVYEKDPDARAVVLYEESMLSYILVPNIVRENNCFSRIKILKQEGVDLADVEISFIDSNIKERVTAIEAVAYNLVNGKVVKTPLKKQYIFTEVINKSHSKIKFSIPEVRVGTVIEYRYRLSSPMYSYIDPVTFQYSIPVARYKMKMVIPEYFRVRLNQKGYASINIKDESGSDSFIVQNNDRHTFITRVIEANGVDIPALKSEPFVWCLNDFRSMLQVEVTQIAFPNSITHSFSGTWEKVNAEIEESSFSNYCKLSNPYKEEVKQIVAQQTDPHKKAHAILKLVQSKIKWDGNYRLYSNGPRAAATKGSGTSADINFLLMSALKDGGFDVVPILLNPRKWGRMPYTFASIEQINAFILRINLDEGQYIYLDGTNQNSDLNVLPQNLLVDRARVYGNNGEDGWCDLTQLCRNNIAINMLLKLNEDTTIGGTIFETRTNQAAFNISEQYVSAESEEKFMEMLEKEHKIEIDNFKIEGIGTMLVKMEYSISLPTTSNDQYIYINSTIIPFMSQNQFNAESRILPIEFPETQLYNIKASVALPQGYIVEDRPKNMMITLQDNSLSCRYISQISANALQLNSVFAINKLVFASSEFQEINTFFGAIVDLNNSQIVIRKESTE